mmetsp:Transcript_34367/g.70876  ORF Transcript_34367/g.70876 Transcript_34367/m.70876 type:complete len:203 (+) Transcript_34367:259-867(+)
MILLKNQTLSAIWFLRPLLVRSLVLQRLLGTALGRSSALWMIRCVQMGQVLAKNIEIAWQVSGVLARSETRLARGHLQFCQSVTQLRGQSTSHRLVWNPCPPPQSGGHRRDPFLCSEAGRHLWTRDMQMQPDVEQKRNAIHPRNTHQVAGMMMVHTIRVMTTHQANHRNPSRVKEMTCHRTLRRLRILHIAQESNGLSETTN